MGEGSDDVLLILVIYFVYEIYTMLAEPHTPYQRQIKKK